MTLGNVLSLVRQAKLGASCRVRVPAGQGLVSRPYQVLTLSGTDTKEVKTTETEERNNASIHRKLCGPQWGAALLAKLIQLRYKQSAGGDGVIEPEASREDAAMTWRLEPVGVKERGTHGQRHTRTWETQAGVRQHGQTRFSESEGARGRHGSQIAPYYSETGKPITWGREQQGCAPRTGNMARI
jgi:hypothetical protein